MIRFKKALAVWLCLGALASQSHGQALPEPHGNQPPPAFGVLDTGGFFSRSPGSLKRISDLVRKLESDHGYSIYLVVEPVLVSTTASERASELHRAWVPEGNGLVLVFETDSRNLGVGRDQVGKPPEAGNRARVASRETAAMITRATNATHPKLGPDAYLEALVANLVGEFDDYFKRRDTSPPAARSMKIGMLIVGTVSLLGLGAIGVGGLIRHSKMAATRSFRFPAVDRPERLGAPCGGSVTARRFAPPISKT